MTPDQAISGWLRIFAKEFLVNRARDIVQQGLINTEDLLRSLDAKVNSSPENGIHFMVFFARNYGRFQDMRRRYSRVGGEELVEALEDWIKQEGVGKFTQKNKKDYAKIYKGQPPERIINKIAWGIIRKYEQKGTARKRSWYNRGKERDINTQYDVLNRIWSEAVAQQHKNAYTSKQP